MGFYSKFEERRRQKKKKKRRRRRRKRRTFSTRDEKISPRQLHYSCLRAHSAPGVASCLTHAAE
jgi:hypothetical protein